MDRCARDGRVRERQPDGVIPVPEMSVVMSVYNGAAHLPETLDSVLSQQGCEFEFVVVNDGSYDGSGKILDDYAAADSRLRVIHQQNTGLTRALMRGCALARGEFIARQDVGDISLAGRLEMQRDFLLANPMAVMCCGGVRIVGPLGELLYEVAMPMEQLDDGLRRLEGGPFQGPPHHGATCFRTSAYRLAGGYRLPFAVAQDVDLWLRLAELGKCLGMGNIQYEVRLDIGSISSRRRAEQLRLCALAVSCAKTRSRGESDELLLKASAPGTAAARSVPRMERARFNYFIASCLRRNGNKAASQYYRRAVEENPFHFKAIFWLLHR